MYGIPIWPRVANSCVWAEIGAEKSDKTLSSVLPIPEWNINYVMLEIIDKMLLIGKMLRTG